MRVRCGDMTRVGITRKDRCAIGVRLADRTLAVGLAPLRLHRARGPKRMTIIPKTAIPAPRTSHLSGRWPSTSHSHITAVPTYTPP